MGRGGSGPVLGPAAVATGQGLFTHSMLQVAEMAHAARIKSRKWRTPPARAGPRAFAALFFFSLSHLAIPVARPGVLTGRRQLGTRHRTPAWLRPRSRPRSRPASQASGQHCSGPVRIAAHCEAEPWTGAAVARRTAGRLSPAGLRLATSTTLSVAVHSGRLSRRSRADWAGNRASHPRDHELD